MSNPIDAGLDKLSIPTEHLRSRLRAVEEEHIGELSPELVQARNCLLDVLPTYATTRLQFGRVLYRYKVHFKARGGWVAAASAMAAAMRCSEKTIYRLAYDYERTSGLSPVFLEALEDEGIDPAAPRNAEIVSQLFNVPVPDAPEKAAETVAAVVRDDHERRKAERARKKAEKTHQRNESGKQENRPKEEGTQPVERVGDRSGIEEEDRKRFAVHIAAKIEKRLETVPSGDLLAEASRIFGMIGTSLGFVVTVAKFPPRRLLPPKPWEQNKSA